MIIKPMARQLRVIWALVAAGGAGDKLIVYASFSPATGCTSNAFVFFSSDPYYKETYAAMLLAKATGKSIRYLHVYCTAEGYSRGNEYMLLDN
jgi:hypothetical protein